VSFRTRLLLTVAAVALVSLAVLAFGLRRDVSDQLAADYGRRIEATVTAIEADLRLESERITDRLVALRDGLQDDNRFRVAAVAGAASERQYLLDYAGAVIGLTGLSVLQIHDDDGRIVSSGHFRNEHGRLAAVLARRLVANPDDVAFLMARTPEREFMALVRGEELRVGGSAFTLVGGIALDRLFFERLARDREVSVSLLYPGLDESSNPDLAPRLAGGDSDGAQWRGSSRQDGPGARDPHARTAAKASEAGGALGDGYGRRRPRS
jgi:hypothetical protein